MSDLTVLYDGNCALCRNAVSRLRRLDTSHRIEMLPLQDSSVPDRFPQVDRDKAMRIMAAVDPKGNTFFGVDSYARIGALLRGWRFIAWMLRIPGIHFLAAQIYGWVARNRYRWNRATCADGSCTIHGAGR